MFFFWRKKEKVRDKWQSCQLQPAQGSHIAPTRKGGFISHTNRDCHMPLESESSKSLKTKIKTEKTQEIHVCHKHLQIGPVPAVWEVGKWSHFLIPSKDNHLHSHFIHNYNNPWKNTWSELDSISKPYIPRDYLFLSDLKKFSFFFLVN